MKTLVVASAAALALFAAAGAALACGTSGRLAYADAFDTFRSDWGDQDEEMKLKGGELTFAETDGQSYTIYASPMFREVDFCLTMKVTESSAFDETYGGIIFWARDYDHYYGFQITPDGYATVFEYADDFMMLIDDVEFSAIKQGIGAINELRVVTKGRNATFYVNDKVFDTLTSKTPPGTQHIGIAVDAPTGDKAKAAFAFDNVQVRN
jgi:hypothetical protein